MTQIWFDNDGKRHEKPTKNGHKGHGRRRRYGYTEDGVRITRPAMVKRQRPAKKGKKRNKRRR